MTGPSMFEAVVVFGIGLLGLACAVVAFVAWLRHIIEWWNTPVTPRWVSHPEADRRSQYRNRRGF
jgi:hypothetical protein